MTEFHPMRELPARPDFSSEDTLVIFGELFGGGYVNGLIEEAKSYGMSVIYSTVGRRDSERNLRPLTEDEIASKGTPIINVPLEAGFDMTPSSQGISPCDQLKGIKLKEWDKASLDWDQIAESESQGMADFRQRATQWANAVADQINPKGKVVFAHTMAGGIPRAKIMMPAMNRVFKGAGERFASSEEFWSSELGKLCDRSFLAVTADTFQVLLEVTDNIRRKVSSAGGQTSYTAYGYHGTEILVNGEYKWQSFGPYLQGWAKMKLEDYSSRAFEEDIKSCVFNSPEILTNSSGVFSGIEIPLYTLVMALEKENTDGSLDQLIDEARTYLKDDITSKRWSSYLNDFFSMSTIKDWPDFAGWPQHNGPAQSELIKKSSAEMAEWQKDPKNPVSYYLSEIIFKACGKIMLSEAASVRKPVWWIGHDAVARAMKS